MFHGTKLLIMIPPFIHLAVFISSAEEQIITDGNLSRFEILPLKQVTDFADNNAQDSALARITLPAAIFRVQRRDDLPVI